MGAKVDSMFSVGVSPSHEEGNIHVLIQPPTTVEEALRVSGLDWELELRPVMTMDGMVLPKQKEVYRPDTKEHKGFVGPRHHIIQNKDLFALVRYGVGKKALQFETAGSIGGGDTVWYQLAPGPAANPADLNPNVPFILVTHAHWGKGRLTAMPTAVRVVDDRTLQRVVSAAKQRPEESIWFKHTESMLDNLEVMKAALASFTGDFTKVVSAYQAATKQDFRTSSDSHVRAVRASDHPSVEEFLQKFRNGG